MSGLPEQLAQSRRAVRRRRRLENLFGGVVVMQAGACHFDAEQVIGPFVDGHPQRQLTAVRMGEQKQPGPSRLGSEDLVDSAVCQFDTLLRALDRLRIRRRAAVARSVKRHHGVVEGRAGTQHRQPRMAWTVEIRCRAGTPVEGNDYGAGVRCFGDQAGHRDAVDEDDAGPRSRPGGDMRPRSRPGGDMRPRSRPGGDIRPWLRSAHVSVRSSSTPLGVRPPLLATATRASFT
jgi:hypothetical protein